MKVSEAIGTVDKLMPNCIDNVEKIRWLRRLDQQITDEIVNTHEKPIGYKEPKFETYGMDTDLIVEDIHAELYITYLKMKISLEQVEADRYAMEQTAYNNAYITYRDFYNRKHMPVTKKFPKYR